jgi:uncharacterized protein YjgD (DUF1641 family)
MAKPVPLDLPPRDPREELRARLQHAPLEHAEALLAGYEVLQGLHDRGVLELLRGLLGSGDQVVRAAVDAARTPPALRALRNLVNVAKMLGEIDPEEFAAFVGALPEALHTASQTPEEPPGVLALLRRFRSKELRRGIVAVNSLLEIWGREFFSGARSPSQD